MKKSSARFLFVLLLLVLWAAAFIPAAHADTVQKISVGGRPDGPVVDTATGDVYVVNDGAPGKPSNNVFVISGTSLVATLALNSTRGADLGTPLTNLRAGTYDSGDGYVYFPDQAGVGTPLAVVSGTEEVGNPSVGYPASIATYDPSNGYVYIPDGEVTMHLCTVDCTLPGGEQVNNLGLGIGYCTGADTNGCQPYNPSKPASENDPREVTVEYGRISVVSGLTSVANITIGWDSGDPYNPNVPGFNESQDPTVTPAFDPSNNLVYVADTKFDVVYAISGTSVVGTIPVGSESTTPVVDPTNGYVYVPNSKSDSISVIDYTTVVATISLSGAVAGLIYDPGDGNIYADGLNNIWVISGDSVLATLNFGESGGAAYDSSNGYLYFSDSVNGTVDAIDGTGLVYSDKVGGTPTSIVFDPMNGYLYATDEVNGVVDVIMPASGIVVGSGCSSSSSSTTRSSSTTSSGTTTTTTACCTAQSQSRSSTTTSTSSSCTGVVVGGSSGNETGNNSTSSASSNTGSVAVSVTAIDTDTGSASTGGTPPPTGPDGIPLVDLEIAGAVGAVAAVGGAILYLTQGGGSGGSEDGGCEAPPDCAGGPVGPTENPSPSCTGGSITGHGTREVTAPCSLATASGPSVNCACVDYPSCEGHATRTKVTSACVPVTCGPSVNSPTCGHGTREVAAPSSLATVCGPIVNSPTCAHASREAVTPCSLATVRGPSVNCSSVKASSCDDHAARVPITSACVPAVSGPSVSSCVNSSPCQGHAVRAPVTSACVPVVSGPSVAPNCVVPGRAVRCPNDLSSTPGVTGASMNCTAAVRSAPVECGTLRAPVGHASLSSGPCSTVGVASTPQSGSCTIVGRSALRCVSNPCQAVTVKGASMNCTAAVRGASLNCTTAVKSASFKGNPSSSAKSTQTNDSCSQSSESGCSSTAEDTPACG